MFFKKTIITKVPTHVAVIMDGNRRWARSRFLAYNKGHEVGSKKLKELCAWCIEYKIPYLSVYALSSENWKRSEQEISDIINLLDEYLSSSEVSQIIEKNVRINFVGEVLKFGKSVTEKMEKIKQECQRFTPALTLNVALNYGSRAEITSAVKLIVENKIPLESINEETISSFLQSSGIPDPDLLIRTGGNYRISNFLLWQCSYTELFFVKTLWPDFSKKCFTKALKFFSNQERRFGS